MKSVWYASGLTALALGLLGVVLPLLPTVPFILLAAFCFAKCSPRMQAWLENHATFGPMIHDWREKGAISRPAKRLATVSIAIVFAISLALGVATWVLAIQAIALLCVLVFIWTRPSA
ncbi:YbaN family protein [Pseudaestuariivita atlantica]|uniref:Membrane protein n=1 Tax=Pseudaestuariivita atlantica TaxID=1317121 RepID=A0A0L1JQ63_9RHOB|nr:YbaN family protein [Pseudaestuariivita atlantica]KNG93909.1 membrane protein [Pseudaestuariivita atlantica]